MTIVTYYGSVPQPASSSSNAPAANAAQDQLKGVVIFANMPLPTGAPSFYWECELCSLGESGGQEEVCHMGMGLSPRPPTPEGESPPASFSLMKDTCLVRRYGVFCHLTPCMFINCCHVHGHTNRHTYVCTHNDYIFAVTVLEKQFSTLETVCWTGRAFVYQTIH